MSRRQTSREACGHAFGCFVARLEIGPSLVPCGRLGARIAMSLTSHIGRGRLVSQCLTPGLLQQSQRQLRRRRGGELSASWKVV